MKENRYLAFMQHLKGTETCGPTSSFRDLLEYDLNVPTNFVSAWKRNRDSFLEPYFWCVIEMVFHLHWKRWLANGKQSLTHLIRLEKALFKRTKMRKVIWFILKVTFMFFRKIFPFTKYFRNHDKIIWSLNYKNSKKSNTVHIDWITCF